MRTAVCILAACVALLASMAREASAAGVAGHLRYAIDNAASTADYSLTAKRIQYVILKWGETKRMRELKAANPNVKVLLYQDASGMVTRDAWGGTASGVTTQEADANPSWYLLNTDGQRFTFRHYSWIWAADIGNPGYQQRWADNVLAKLAEGWDGVFMDDVNPSMQYHYDVARVAKYPTDAAYQAATKSMLAAVYPRLQSAGKLAIANFGFYRDYASVLNGWLPHLDGAMDEHFTKFNATSSSTTTYVGGAEWKTQLGEVRAAEALGKAFLGVGQAPNTDAAAARYGWATVLLAGQGRATYALHGDYTNETWFPEYDYAIGDPVESVVELAGGVHRRRFTTGLVLVNPTSTSQTVDLGGRYSGSGLTDATSAVMAPRTALVLVGTAFPAPTPAPVRPDKALYRPVTASSFYGPGREARLAVDGSSTTRWSSSYSDDQWWQVDLGSEQTVDTVRINWEIAYASRYRISTATTAGRFATVADVTIGAPGVKTTTFPARRARWIRITGVTRATKWGISFWDVNVFGT